MMTTTVDPIHSSAVEQTQLTADATARGQLQAVGVVLLETDLETHSSATIGAYANRGS